MGLSWRTTCRYCGTDLQLAWWRVLLGMRTCPPSDRKGCLERFWATQPHGAPLPAREHARRGR